MDSKILRVLTNSVFFQKLNASLNNKKPVSIFTEYPQSWSLLIAYLSLIKPTLIIVPSSEAYILSLEVASWGGKVRILSSENDDFESELFSFYEEAEQDQVIYIATSEALNIPININKRTKLEINQGEVCVRGNLIDLLDSWGYQRTDMVIQPGDFAVRGYIFDIFEPKNNHIFRLEFDEKDEVKNIRIVDPLTQLSIKPTSSCCIHERKVIKRGNYTPFYKTIPEKYLVGALQINLIASENPDSNNLAEVNWNVFISSESKKENDLVYEITPAIPYQQFSGYQIIVSEYINRVSHLIKDNTYLLEGKIRSGFNIPEESINILSDRELFGIKTSTYPPPLNKRPVPIEMSEGFERDSPVVHLKYGIGIFRGLKPVEIAGEIGEFLELEFAKGDKLYIPFDQLHLIRRYNGADNYILSSLDNKDWIKVKKSAEERANLIADNLLEIYAKRKLQTGFSFNIDEAGEEEFKKGFHYEETPDQFKAIQDVKNDLSSSVIMDRLICGDVGYGKTEVALRASFHAVFNYKQVAILAPTTILAHQHYWLFKERFAPFPVKIGIITSFSNPREIKSIKQELKAGLVDIVIGTHSLLQDDIQFKDLGLLIIDEEHRFGVMQKEKLKNLKINLDTLYLSATPIPRTLKMSLEGIKDISLLYSPPLGRHEVNISVKPYNLETIEQAIEKELKRGGQVFYVHNRIASISRVEENLKKLLPNISTGIAHGQMNKRSLEKIMWQFYNGEIKVLISTTIIEAGLDIPRANTLIIEDSQNLGLSELYQLRGRVGRSNIRSYVHLLYAKKNLTKEAEQRFKAILDSKGLGSGFRIALADMEIRGTGNFFGTEQHGNIIKVGLDLFTEMVVQRLKGVAIEENSTKPPINMSIDCQAYFPVYYITDEALRLYFYKQLSNCRTNQEFTQLSIEILDKFGKAPLEVDNLFKIVKLKRIAEELKANKIVVREGKVYLSFERKISNKDLNLLIGSKLVNPYLVEYNFSDLV